MAAGCAVLDVLAGGDAYERLERLGAVLEAGLRDISSRAGVPVAVNRVASMITPFLGVPAVSNFAEARRASAALFAAVHRSWIAAGVFWPPSQFESALLSTAHAGADLDRALSVFETALRTTGPHPVR
jgi:glutamate-1-semialdehyde 2,1-aminomutase